MFFFFLVFSITSFAHTVDSYTRSCTFTSLTLKANVSNVYSNSYYSWQYKNSSGSWICFVNGNNTINGVTYSVTGAKSANTTSPASLVISNTTTALDGLVVRMLIKDGGDPCTGTGTIYNTGTSSNNFTLQISNSPCQELCLGNLVFNDANKDGLKGTSELGIVGATVKLYNDANNDNIVDGAAIATTSTDANGIYKFCGLSAGNYIVGVVTPSGFEKSATNGGDPDNNIDNDNNGITVVSGEVRGSAITLSAGSENNGSISTTNTNNTYDFGFAAAANCNCPNNLVTNPSFEDGTTGWSSSGGTFSAGTGAVACGAKSGDFQITNTSSNWVSQTISSGTISPGSVITASVYAGTHDASFYHHVSIQYFNSSWQWISATQVEVNKVLPNPQLYSFTSTVPVGAYYIQVSFGGTGSWIKTDQWCVNVTSSPCDPNNTSAANGFCPLTPVCLSGSTYNFTQSIDKVTGNASVVRLISGTTNSYTLPSSGYPADFSGAVVVNVSDVVSYDGYVGRNTVTQTNEKWRVVFKKSGVTVATTPYTNDIQDLVNQASWKGSLGTAILLPNGTDQIVLEHYDVANGYTGPGSVVPVSVCINYYKPATIGDFVWHDLNANGLQESNELGINNVTVELLNSTGNVIATTTTNSAGFYQFTGLPAGTYGVRFTTPVGFIATPSNQGGNDLVDSDPVNGVVSGIVLTAGQTNNSIDAGFIIPLGSIGDKVWNDVNRNGIQDNNEVGVAGVTVSLFNNSGTLIATTITDAYGIYLFTTLPVASGGTNYQVRFSLPPAYQFSAQTQGANTNLDSDPNTATGRTGNITLTPANRDRRDVDAGINYTIPSRIGDFVWYDNNSNGIQDADEPGIAGVTLTLYNSGGVVVATTITDNNGYYQFSDVAPGTYTLGVSAPIGFNLTSKDLGGDDAKDSDFDPSTFRTSSFVVTNGTVNLTFDAGFVAMQNNLYAAVGDRVWHDINNNGLQTEGEPGVANVTVQLYTSAGVLVGTRTTDALGYYMFNNLTPGSYYVKFSNYPAGYTVVTANVGGVANEGIDSDVDESNGSGTTPTFSLIAGQTKITVDAGIRNSTGVNNSRLGDFVWYDLNKNGVQDAGEAGVPGVTATLYNATTNVAIKSVITDALGKYLFTDLSIGSYIVGFTNIPAGYNFSAIDQGGDDTKDSDVNPDNNRTGVYTIVADGTSNLTVDAGIITVPNVTDGKATLGDKVWHDFNKNGLQDANESGVVNVTVTLYAGDGTTVIATTTTDGLGNYIFTNLNAGNYVVGFSNLPSGYQFSTPSIGSDRSLDSDPNITTGKSQPVTLLPGEINLSVDAGIYATTPKSSLGDRVWFDVNKNGIQDNGEVGAEGVTVTLYDASGVFISSTVTTATGNYIFADLNAGSYIIGFSNLPAGYTATAQNVLGSTVVNNSDADVVTLKTGVIILAANTNDPTWDLGIITSLKAAVGDYVWNDQNSNGIQDATEVGVAGITVTLYNNGVSISSTVTDANGAYLFSNLEPGTYTIGFSNLPINTTFTTKNAAGSNADNNSDVNTSNGITDAFTLIPGQFKTDVDAGLITNFAAVGDFVWYDVNSNGRQDAGEQGVPGVLATLYNIAGQKVASAVTDGTGKYFINNIPVASLTSFTIGFSNLPYSATKTYSYTIKNAPIATLNNNSDVNPATGRTDVFTLQPSQVRLDIDAGLIFTTGGPLPVSFTNLKGVYNQSIATLNWASLTEINFNAFEVEHSIDGFNFTKVGTINGIGNTASRTEYMFDHKQPQNGANYYRLKMVDKDGNFTYSNVVVINVAVKGISVVGVYPNPFVDRVNISVSTEKTEVVTIKLFDNTGKLVRVQQTKAQSGTNVIAISNLNTLARGMYIIDVQTSGASLKQQIIK